MAPVRECARDQVVDGKACRPNPGRGLQLRYPECSTMSLCLPLPVIERLLFPGDPGTRGDDIQGRGVGDDVEVKTQGVAYRQGLRRVPGRLGAGQSGIETGE